MYAIISCLHFCYCFQVFSIQSFQLIEVLVFHQGIYETKVPLEFNAILQIGCVCKVDRTAKNRNPQEGWSLAELQMKTTTEYSYLEQSITFFYLYHRYTI